MSQKSLTTLRPVSANEFYTLRGKPKTFHKSQGNYVSNYFRHPRDKKHVRKKQTEPIFLCLFSIKEKLKSIRV